MRWTQRLLQLHTDVGALHIISQPNQAETDREARDAAHRRIPLKQLWVALHQGFDSAAVYRFHVAWTLIAVVFVVVVAFNFVVRVGDRHTNYPTL